MGEKEMKLRVLTVIICAITVVNFASANIILGPSSPVPDWNQTQTDQFMTYINPSADFMLVEIGTWPNRIIASRTKDSETNQWNPPVDLGFYPPDAEGGYLSPDKKTLFYCSWGSTYRSYWNDTSWLPIPGELISELYNQTGGWLMFNGSKLYFTTGNNFFVSDYNLETDQFSQAKPLVELNNYYGGMIWVSSDGHLMLFSSIRPGGYGSSDIWSATWDESLQKWGNIENLGPNINTSGDESLPRIAEDAHILFFNRNYVLMQASTSKPVSIDIKPGSDKNPLNVKEKGVLPVAILGTGDFEVFKIDPTSIRLTGVAPIRSSYEDVSTPADGKIDLVLKFNVQDIVAKLGDVKDGDVVELTLTGELSDGTNIEGKDNITIISKDKK
jgi:hypothetical protein